MGQASLIFEPQILRYPMGDHRTGSEIEKRKIKSKKVREKVGRKEK